MDFGGARHRQIALVCGDGLLVAVGGRARSLLRAKAFTARAIARNK